MKKVIYIGLIVTLLSSFSGVKAKENNNTHMEHEGVEQYHSDICVKEFTGKSILSSSCVHIKREEIISRETDCPNIIVDYREVCDICKTSSRKTRIEEIDHYYKFFHLNAKELMTDMSIDVIIKRERLNVEMLK